MSTLALALTLLRRDFRAGEWRVLLLALVLATGSIATVSLFADRVRQALHQQAHALLGADLRLTSNRELPPEYRQEAQRRGLLVTQTSAFPSVVRHAGSNALAEILAVQKGYPLRGAIEIDDGAAHLAHGIPAAGTAWVDARAMRRLGLQHGNVIEVGALHLRVSARVLRDVDPATGFAAFAPRVLINTADLAASGLLQEGSRLNRGLLLAGAEPAVSGMRAWLKERLRPGERLEDVSDARPEIRVALERAEHFLGLAALTAVVLAGVALALAARRFLARHLDACAVMRCLGASQSQVLALFLWQFLLVGLGAVALGDALGYAVQAALVRAFPALREIALPAPGWLPLIQAAASGLALLLGFTFLPLWQLKRTPPLRVIRRELAAPGGVAALLYLSGAAVLAGLFLWQAGSAQLGWTVLAALAAGMLAFGGLAWLLLRGLPIIFKPFGLSLSKPPIHSSTSSARTGVSVPPGQEIRHALTNLARNGRANAVQVVALSLGGMALLSLTLIRDDLLQSWADRLPPDAPNRFLVSVQPDQVQGVSELLVQHGLPKPGLLPMVRGRLLAINRRAVRGEDYPEPRARALVEREFNLSWATALPSGNVLTAGQWWPARPTGPELSVEEGIARTLGIRLGDTLEYEVAGERFSARVSSLRRAQWDSMQVNFFVIAAPGLLENYPASYISSFYLPPDRQQAETALLARYSNVLVIDTETILAEVRGIITQVTRALGAVFLFTLLAGLAVLYAALLSTQDERIRQAAILRTLGADSRYLRRLHLAEFAVLGGLSGLFAAAGAELLGYALAQRVLDLPFRVDPQVWLLGIAGGVLIVTGAGWLNTRKVTNLPPMRLLTGS